MKVLCSIVLTAASLLVGCQVKPYAPPPEKAVVESVEVSVQDFNGRPEGIAVVKGRLTSSAAQLIDAEQSRANGVLFVEVREQTPRGAALSPDLTMNPAFETRISLDLLGLEPGKYLVSVNDVIVDMQIPEFGASGNAADLAEARIPQYRSERELPDAMIPIEDAP